MYQILVVEDEPLVRMATVDVFLDAGHSVVEAAGADDALFILQKRSDIGLVVTDVDMPGSLDGAALAYRIQRDYPHLPVVVVSGVLPKPALPTGVPFFAKPVRDEVLRGLVANISSLDVAVGSDK